MKKKFGKRVFSFILSLMMVLTALFVGGVEVRADEEITLQDADFDGNFWSDGIWSCTTTAWTGTTDVKDATRDANTVKAFEFWRDGTGDATVTQVVSSLEAGTYRISVDATGKNATVKMKIGDNVSAAVTISDNYTAWNTLSNTITINTDLTNVPVGFVLEATSGGAQVDSIKLENVSTGGTNTEGYKVVITADDASVDVNDTVSLSAKVTYNGTEITDLAANNLKLWWWVENTSDVTLSDHDSTNGLSRTAKATVLTAGTYKVYATLKDNTDTEQYKGEITLTAAGPAPVYEFSIAADKTEVAPGETVKLTATVKKDGVEVTDLESAGLHIWWSHDWSNGEQDAVYDSANSRNLTCDVKVTSEGEYYFSAKLQDASWTDIDQKYITLKGKATDVTETTDTNDGDAGIEEQTEGEQGTNIELVNADFSTSPTGTWTGEVTSGWIEGNSMDVVSYSTDAWLELPSYVGTTGLKFSMNHSETMTVLQWLESVPAGTYTITAPVMGENTDIYLVLGDQEIKATSLSGYNNWSKAKATFTITEDMTDVKVGFKLVAKSSGSNYSWGWIDSISLVKGVPATGDTTNVMGFVALMVTGAALVFYTSVKRRKVNF